MRQQSGHRRAGRRDADRETRTPANTPERAGGAAQPLLGQQAAVGNAAVGRMLGRTGRPAVQRAADDTGDGLSSRAAEEAGSWRIPFAKGSKDLSPAARQEIERAVTVAIDEGVRADRAGRPKTEVDVVGHGNGPRLGRDRLARATATGGQRAAGVDAAFRAVLGTRTGGSAPPLEISSGPWREGEPRPAGRAERRTAGLSVRNPGQSVLGGRGADAVEHVVHAIWLGPEMATYNEKKKSGKSVGGLSGTARDNLTAWQSRVAAGGWRLKVWGNESAFDANRDFYEELRARGSVDLENVDGVFGDEHARAGEVMRTAMGKQVFTLASDVARYGILYREGGVYVDVDIHPDRVELPAEGPTGEKDGVPFFAPELQDSEQFETLLASINKERAEGNLEPLSADDPDALQSVVDRQYEAGLLNNNFIVTPADSAFLRRLLEELPEPSSLAQLSTETLKRNAAEKTGPNYIRNQIEKQLKEKKLWPWGKRWADMFKDRRIVFSKEQRAIWDRLGWLTAESDITGEKRSSD